MKILITGSARFIGFYLAKELLNPGDTVQGIDNINDYHDPELKYSRLAKSDIKLEVEQWYATPVQSTLSPNYRFMRMNLEDCEQINTLFET